MEIASRPSSSSAAFTLAIVAAYVFILLSGSLLLIGGITNYELAFGNWFPGPGMMPLMTGSPYGGGFMFPMMTSSNHSSLVWSSLSGIVVGAIVLASGILLYTYIKQQMLWGTIIVASAIVGLLSGGGFFIGSVLGIVGGLISITVRIP